MSTIGSHTTRAGSGISPRRHRCGRGSLSRITAGVIATLLGASAAAGGESSPTLRRVAGGGNLDGLARLEAPIGYPVALEEHGGTVYFIAENSVRAIGADGTVRTVAGSWRPGHRDGAADEALFHEPRNLAVGTDGTVYVADTENDRIRAIDAETGTVRTVAGDGDRGYTGDGMAATASSLGRPTDVAVDAQGRVLIAEHESRRIRRIEHDGTLTTIAGNGQAGRVYDGSRAAGNPIPRPYALDAGSDGSIYFTAFPLASDGAPYFYPVMKVDPEGRLWTLTSLAYAGYPNPLNVQAMEELPYPSLLSFHGFPYGIDERGDVVYVVDGAALSNQGTIWRISTPSLPGVEGSRTTSRYAGRAGCSGPDGDGGPARDAGFKQPYDIEFDDQGNLLVADTLNLRIRRVDAATGLVETFAGDGRHHFEVAGDGRAATDVRLATPCGLAYDASGNLYVNDFSGTDLKQQVGPRIRRVAADGRIWTVAGTGYAGVPIDGAAATATPITPECGLSHAGGSLFFPDTSRDPNDPVGPGLHTVQRLDLASGRLVRFAGEGPPGSGGDGGPARSARLSVPKHVLAARDGTVYIATWGDGRIRAVDPSGIIRTVASSLAYPSGMALNADGDLLVAEAGRHVVQRIDLETGALSVFAGNGDPDTDGSGYGDGGPATLASLSSPSGVTVDAEGNVYVADRGHRRIRVVRPDGSIDAFACSGASPLSEAVSDGPALAGPCAPHQLAVSPTGQIGFTDVLLPSDLAGQGPMSFDVSLVREVGSG